MDWMNIVVAGGSASVIWVTLQALLYRRGERTTVLEERIEDMRSQRDGWKAEARHYQGICNAWSEQNEQDTERLKAANRVLSRDLQDMELSRDSWRFMHQEVAQELEEAQQANERQQETILKLKEELKVDKERHTFWAKQAGDAQREVRLLKQRLRAARTMTLKIQELVGPNGALRPVES